MMLEQLLEVQVHGYYVRYQVMHNRSSLLIATSGLIGVISGTDSGQIGKSLEFGILETIALGCIVLSVLLGILTIRPRASETINAATLVERISGLDKELARQRFFDEREADLNRDEADLLRVSKKINIGFWCLFVAILLIAISKILNSFPAITSWPWLA